MNNTNIESNNNAAPMIFVHIPKTAGTSFRIAANNYYGPEYILNDYGMESKTTSPEVLEYYYKSTDVEKLRAASSKYSLITGHYPVARYAEIFASSPIVTFIREPVSRMISEYFHLKNHEGLTLSLKEFYRKEEYCNRQVKLLGGKTIHEIDFVGVTDQYELSLSLFNKKFGAELEFLNMNKGTYKSDILASVPKVDLDEITRLNQEDVHLYEIARQALLDEGVRKCG